MSCTYRFMNSSLSLLSLDRDYDIIFRQQPNRAKISVPNERDKRSIEPPPILQLQWINCTAEEEKKSLQSPFYFMVVNIVHANANDNYEILSSQEYLSGSTVSSLYRLRDIDNTDGGFFAFGDLAVKKQGHFKLHFSLFELIDGKVENRKTIYSNDFIVYTAKQYPGPIESTFLSRTFSDQGIKMRVRKEHRIQQQQPQNSDDSQNLKSRTNVRKRKYDIPSASSSCNNQYNRIIPKEVLSPPSYASDNVHFGRWQSMTHKSKKSNNSTSYTTSPPQPSAPAPMQTKNATHFSQQQPPLSLPSPPPSVSSSSPPTLLYNLPPIMSPAPPILPAPHSHSHNDLQQHHKWMTMEQDNYHPHRLPPLREIIHDKHATHQSYSPFPIDNSFFTRHH